MWLTQDFETVARRIELLGFNAIRIPFSFTDLYTMGPLNYTKPCIHAAPGQVSCCGSCPNRQGGWLPHHSDSTPVPVARMTWGATMLHWT